MKISTHKFVSLAYDLNVGEENEKELMERATADHPLEFIFGTGSMLEAFEKNLEGLSEGDNFDFVLSTEQAYGEYDDDNVMDLPRNIFEVDGKIDEKVVFEGNIVPMMDANGNRLNGSVVALKDDFVTMDFNHPLAGEALHFSGKVNGVREASAEEIAALTMSLGCGCGCGDSGESCGEKSGSCGCSC